MQILITKETSAYLMLYLMTGAPKLPDLMNEIASVIPAKWRGVGIQLGLSSSTLDGIEMENGSKPNSCLQSFEKVFTKWEQQHPKPYTWDTIIGVLRTAAVGENVLAETLSAKH